MNNLREIVEKMLLINVPTRRVFYVFCFWNSSGHVRRFSGEKGVRVQVHKCLYQKSRYSGVDYVHSKLNIKLFYVKSKKKINYLKFTRVVNRDYNIRSTGL